MILTLTEQQTNKPVYINSDKIVYFTVDYYKDKTMSRTKIKLDDSGIEYYVKETPEEIHKLLQQDQDKGLLLEDSQP